MRRHVVIVLTVAAIAFAGRADASTIAWQFTGVTNPFTAPIGGAPQLPSMPISIAMSFDSAALNLCGPVDPALPAGLYQGNTASILVGSYAYTSSFYVEVNSPLGSCYGLPVGTVLRFPVWMSSGGLGDQTASLIGQAGLLAAVFQLPSLPMAALPTMLPTEPYPVTFSSPGGLTATGTLSAVPEPSTLLLLATGAALVRRRRAARPVR